MDSSARAVPPTGSKRGNELGGEDQTSQHPSKRVRTGEYAQDNGRVDLDDIEIAIEDHESRHRQLSMTALCHFLREEFTNTSTSQRKANHYSYNKLREWLLVKAKVPVHVPICLSIVMAAQGNSQQFSVQDDADLVGILALIRKGQAYGHPADADASFSYILLRSEVPALFLTSHTPPAHIDGDIPEGTRERPIDVVRTTHVFQGHGGYIVADLSVCCLPGSRSGREAGREIEIQAGRQARRQAGRQAGRQTQPECGSRRTSANGTRVNEPAAKR